MSEYRKPRLFSPDSRLVQVKIDRELMKEVDIRAVRMEITRRECMEQLLRFGLTVAQTTSTEEIGSHDH